MKIVNCTVFNNSGRIGAKAIGASDSKVCVKDSIVWRHRPSPTYGRILVSRGAEIKLQNCAIEGGIAGVMNFKKQGKIVDAGGNTGQTPPFVNIANPDGADNTFGTSDDGLRLKAGSPSIGADLREGINW